ncbi:MAG: inositol monophosphatase family protein [Peptococcaceae bacterium]
MKELQALLKIVNEVSGFIQDNYYKNQAKFLKQYDHVNVSGDLQKGIDEIVNEKIITLIKEANIPAVIISEETGIIKLVAEPEYFLLLDPIDGSNNVRPWFTPQPNLVISLGLGLLRDLKNKGLDAIEISIAGEIFSPNIYYSLKNEGAFFTNNIVKHKLIPALNCNMRHIPVIGLDLDKKDIFSGELQKVVSQKILVRRLGSTILDLCQVASGQYDAYISEGKRLKITDVCQPYALITAAGGFMKVIPYYNGKILRQNFLYDCLENEKLLNEIRFTIIAAGNEVLLQELQELLKLNDA